MNERRAPVQQDCYRLPVGTYCAHTAASPEHHSGTVAWEEHEEAWADYAIRHRDQTAERLAQRGGFGYAEITDHLGHPPRTWRADE
jgi:hypothetical protein